VREELITIKSGRHALYGMAHIPEKKGEKYPGVILFHGFTGTSIEPHRFFVKTARALAEKGKAVLRFDFSGAGQSGGKSEDVDFFDWVNDAEAAYSYFKSRKDIEGEKISAAGLSMGSAVLLQLLSQNKIKTEKNIFLAPGADLPHLIPGIMENNRKEGGCYIVNGNRISEESMKKASEVDLFSADYPQLAPSLIQHCKNDETVPYAVGEALENFLKRRGAETKLVLYEEGGHTFNIPDVEEKVIREICLWVS